MHVLYILYIATFFKVNHVLFKSNKAPVVLGSDYIALSRWRAVKFYEAVTLAAVMGEEAAVGEMRD